MGTALFSPSPPGRGSRCGPSCGKCHGLSFAPDARRVLATISKFYGFYTPPPGFTTPFLCPGPDTSTVAEHGESVPMDVVYLLFSFVLFAASIGFLLICDRLGRRP